MTSSSSSDAAQSDGLPAGDFSEWVSQMQDAIRGERDSDVPCNGCTACCTASQFIHIAPDETDTLAHVPPQLLFPAPRMPAGHVLMGYDQSGQCPMLKNGKCSIYNHRPRTCRTYDCRVFPAVGIEPDDQNAIADRARRWQFSYPSEIDRAQHAAVRAAAARYKEHSELNGASAMRATELAVLAIERHDAFSGDGSTRNP
ncbi:MAG: YkgJ family cysteine cluster protein [Actinomycetia bacterium]|nr:YkgJ family cysteine cluster protein [Actinomycetes bacterium]